MRFAVLLADDRQIAADRADDGIADDLTALDGGVVHRREFDILAGDDGLDMACGVAAAAAFALARVGVDADVVYPAHADADADPHAAAGTRVRVGIAAGFLGGFQVDVVVGGKEDVAARVDGAADDGEIARSFPAVFAARDNRRVAAADDGAAIGNFVMTRACALAGTAAHADAHGQAEVGEGISEASFHIYLLEMI